MEGQTGEQTTIGTTIMATRACVYGGMGMGMNTHAPILYILHTLMVQNNMRLYELANN
jgi:hypothetical protein